MPSTDTTKVLNDATAMLSDALAACTHNDWDNVRIRRGVATLRCRVCQVQFKTPQTGLKHKRCRKFTSKHGCAAGPECVWLHINGSKQSLTERVEVHGKLLLLNIPESDLPENLASMTPQLSPMTIETHESDDESSAADSGDSDACSANKKLLIVGDDGGIEEYDVPESPGAAGYASEIGSPLSPLSPLGSPLASPTLKPSLTFTPTGSAFAPPLGSMCYHPHTIGALVL